MPFDPNEFEVGDRVRRTVGHDPVNPNRAAFDTEGNITGHRFGSVQFEDDEGGVRYPYAHLPDSNLEHVEEGDHPRLEMTDEDRAWAEHARQREAERKQKFLYTFLVNQAKSIALTNHLFKQLTKAIRPEIINNRIQADAGGLEDEESPQVHNVPQEDIDDTVAENERAMRREWGIGINAVRNDRKKAIKGPNRVDKIVADDALYYAGLEALNENEIADIAERNVRQASHTRQRPLYVGDERETIREKDRRPTINAVRNAKAIPRSSRKPRFQLNQRVRVREGVGTVIRGPAHNPGHIHVVLEGKRSARAYPEDQVYPLETKSIKAIRKDVADRAIEDVGNISRSMPAEGAARYHNIMS